MRREGRAVLSSPDYGRVTFLSRSTRELTKLVTPPVVNIAVIHCPVLSVQARLVLIHFIN